MDLSKNPRLLQEIIIKRRIIREELANQIIEMLKSMPAGYGLTADTFRSQAIARIIALVPDINEKQ